MKMNKEGVNAHTIRAVGACILSATMSMGLCSGTAFAQSTTGTSNPSDIEKTETVYATLNSDGTVSNTIVSSWIHDGNGINNIKEQLNLKNVENTKTNDKVQKSGDTYTWNASGNDVYYQGDSTQSLPVQVAITYYMDGQEYSAKEMEGKSGHMKINVHFTNTISKVTSSGITVHPGYLAGGVLQLDTGNYTNVTCSSGKVINDGSNEILAFASIPGLADTLNSAGLSQVTEKIQASDDCVIEADVEDFDAGSLMIGMTSDFDLEEVAQTGSISELSSSVNQIVSASDQLEDGAKQLYDGTTQLKTQASPLTSASGSVRQLASAFTQLNSGAKTMADGVKSYTDGVDLLATGTEQLYKITDGVSQVQTGVSGQGTTNLLDGATQLNEGLKQLKEQTDSIDENQLDELQTKLTKAKSTLESMQSTLKTDSAKLDGLQSSLEEATKTLESLQNDQTLSNQITQLASDVQSLNKEISAKNTQISNTNSELQSKVTTINSEIDKINNSISSTVSTAQQNIDSAYSQASSGLDAAAAATDDETAQQAIANAKKALGSAPQIATPTTLSHISVEDLSTLTELDSSQIVKDAQDISSTLSTLGKSLSAMQTKLGSAKDTMSELNTDITKSLKQVDAMSQMISGIDTSMNYKEMMTKLKSASSQLYAGSTQLLGGVQTLNTGLTQLQTQSKSGIDQVVSGSKKLSSNSLALNSGASQLTDGTSQLAAQNSTVNSMADGLDTLNSAFTTLNDGAKELYDGQSQFSSEAMQPLKEMADLTESEVSKLTDVFNEIKSLTEENDNFAGKPEGSTSKVNYVMHTED